ncbi:protein terminus [Drosophila willistoni]|uniref:protein terminus n=1 Tax=Drosophila willistoni TaxID=7260 RepID=UPI001F074D8F|nr:protein terminus [Drosophila willistoni]
MFDEEPISSFVFTNESTTQTFHHQWYAQGQLHECATCFSCIDADEPPSQHWLHDGQESNKLLQLSKQQQAVLDIIEARQIETFFFCDESAKDKLEHFMGETCARGVPELLRWMFHQGNTLSVEFNLACYVNVENQVLIFQSGNLQVDHHYDIEECVSVVYDMLLQRIHNYLDMGLEECSITRLKVQVKRNCIEDNGDSTIDSQYSLPLQLRQEVTGASSLSSSSSSSSSVSSESDLATIRAAYLKHSRECHGYFPPNMRVNLYGLQQCRTTKEIYVVPYHISETLQQLPNKNFLIVNNILGQFQRLHELPTRLATEDTSSSVPASPSSTSSSPTSSNSSRSSSLQCRRCRTQFSRSSKLHIHQQLHCGQDFTVDSMHADIVEIYEQCLPISRTVFQYACYGITKPKTVMRKGQFVPIECDWRSESSVKVQHGPCVVISNAQHSSPSKYY